ncbi:hypothetical protein PAPYR_4305 [Paratrimastix pyriformis]|uniref:DH domain-containing protein n=1 Tax=Paratrimastix pyriformis TaxID=342808 RepID=A0ABQ8UK31_9EUKA|nr:hypothetical protein PAPYR_4305 [Paratrimastix pyriformis]
MADERVNGATLESFLIQPVQRVPRYRLLLVELLKATPATAPDRKALEEAMERFSGVAEAINDLRGAQAVQDQLADLQARLRGLPEGLTLVSPARRLLRQGTAHYRSLHADMILFAFNDLLLACREEQRSSLLTGLPLMAGLLGPGADAARPSYEVVRTLRLARCRLERNDDRKPEEASAGYDLLEEAPGLTLAEEGEEDEFLFEGPEERDAWYALLAPLVASRKTPVNPLDLV